MSKYHSSGRLYTAGELADRRLAMAPNYVWTGFVPARNTTKRALQAKRAARPKGVSK